MLYILFIIKRGGFCFGKKSAKEVIELLANNQVSRREAIDASIQRINEVNPEINAVVTLCKERAYNHADNFDVPNKNSLHGLPILVKDLNNVKGVRTTYGSKIFENFIPDQSDILVENLEKKGAIVLGKTNTPEFGAGSHTFNELFGVTKNPWNTNLTSGGSSGGSSAALATGMAWLATGSDLGGSLRNPAGWCAVAGLRPSAGIVAHGPATLPYNTLSVDGPMARNIDDLALFLDSMSGFNLKDPISRNEPTNYSNSLNENFSPTKIAYTCDFGVFTVSFGSKTINGKN